MHFVSVNVPEALAALVAGKYLSRYGFRAPVLLMFVGSIATCLFQLVLAVAMPAPVYLNILVGLPASMTGGEGLMLTATYSNVALRIPHSLQLRRIMMVTVLAGFGTLISALGGGALGASIGVNWVLSICVALLLLPAFLFLFYFKDIEIPPENKKDSWREAIWFSTINGFTAPLTIIVEYRPHRRRAQIILLLICFSCAFLGLAAGNGTFAFSYARSVLEMDQSKYGLFNGIGLGLIFVFIPPCLKIISKFELSHPVVIALGSFFFMLKFAMLSLTQFWHFFFYIQLVVGLPFFVSLISIRAHITDLLELSKVPIVMALMAAIEKLVPVISGLISTAVWKFTSSSFPGCVYLIMSINYLIAVGLGLYCRAILSWNKRDEQRNLTRPLQEVKPL